jgi:hypothetical protein
MPQIGMFNALKLQNGLIFVLPIHVDFDLLALENASTNPFR